MRQGKFTGFERSAHDPGIALIQFNEPARLNGMTQALKRDLVETLLQAQMDDSVRVVVFTGSGRAFSAGGDLLGRAPGGAGRGRPRPPHPPRRRPGIRPYEGLARAALPLNPPA